MATKCGFGAIGCEGTGPASDSVGAPRRTTEGGALPHGIVVSIRLRALSVPSIVNDRRPV